MPTLPSRNGRGRSLEALLPVLMAAWVILSLGLVGPTPSAPAAEPPAAPAAAPATTPAAAPPTAPAAAPPAAPAGQPAAPAAEPAAAVEKPVIEYTDVPLDPEVEKANKAKRIKMVQVLRGGAFPSRQVQTDFEEYYDKYIFARWKDLSKAHELADFRRDLTNELKMGKSGAAHDRVVEMAMAFFGGLVKDKQTHPAVRVNAMLMIGDLNQVDTSLPTQQPTPLPAALIVMLESLDDPQQIDAVKVVALRKIARHTTLKVADADVLNNQVVPTLLRVATTKVHPGRSPEGHAWVRALAIEALAATEVVGAQGEIPVALSEIVADEEAPMFTRHAAARALGKLKYPDGLELDPMAVAGALGQMAADGCLGELERAREETPIEPVTGTGRGGMYDEEEYGQEYEESYEDGYEEEYSEDMEYDEGEEYDMFRPKKPARKKVDTSIVGAETRRLRRRIKNQAQVAWQGIVGTDEAINHSRWRPPEDGIRDDTPAGVAKLATAGHQQKYVDQLLTQLKIVMDLCDNTDAEELDLMAGIEGSLNLLTDTLAAPLPAAPAAAPAEAAANP